MAPRSTHPDLFQTDGHGNEEGFIRSAINVRTRNPCKIPHFG
jgi:hypothetical protein